MLAWVKDYDPVLWFEAALEGVEMPPPVKPIPMQTLDVWQIYRTPVQVTQQANALFQQQLANPFAQQQNPFVQQGFANFGLGGLFGSNLRPY